MNYLISNFAWESSETLHFKINKNVQSSGACSQLRGWTHWSVYYYQWAYSLCCRSGSSPKATLMPRQASRFLTELSVGLLADDGMSGLLPLGDNDGVTKHQKGPDFSLAWDGKSHRWIYYACPRLFQLVRAREKCRHLSLQVIYWPNCRGSLSS